MPFPFRLLAVVVVLTLGLALGAVAYLWAESARILEHERQELGAVAKLKVDQISLWRSERVGDLATAIANPLLHSQALRALEVQDPGAERDLASWAASYRLHFGYVGIYLVRAGGEVRFAVGEPVGDTRLLTAALRGVAAREPAMSELVRSGPSAAPRLDVLAPLRSAPEGDALGALVLRIDPAHFLFPMLQTWPGSSPSAETLLVRPDGPQVLYLNELRHRNGTALELRLPALSNLPASIAIQGRTDFITGQDYRGITVFAATRPVPDTEWSLVAKVDADEILAPVRRNRLVALAFAALGLMAAIGWARAAWRQQQAEALKRHLAAEIAQRDLEIRLGAIVEQANDIIVVSDEDLRIVEVNHRGVELWGYPRDQIIGRKVTEFRSPAAQLDEARMRDVLERSSRVYETVHRRADGTDLPVEISVRPVTFAGRRLLQAVIRDVSHRKRAEAALRESEESLSATLLSIGDGVIATDVKGCVARMNPVAEKLTGWPLRAAKGRPLDEVFQIISETTRATVESPASQVLRKGVTVGLANHTLLVARDGTERPIKDSGAPIRDTQGAITGVVLVFRDGTDERAAEATLAYQAHLLANISDAVIAADAQLRLTAWNHAAEAMLGWDSKDVIGRGIAEVLRVRGSEAGLHAALARSDHADEVLQLVRRDGTLVSTQGRGVELRDHEGEPMGYVAVLRDVSERLEMQARLRLADRLTSLGTLAAGVAHEINNPLAAVIGNLECAIEDVLSLSAGGSVEGVVEALREAHVGADRVRHIVCDLKMLSRGDDDRLGSVDVVAVLRSAISVTQNEIRHRATLVTEFTGAPCAMGNDSRLAQVFINLLINAAQAIPEGNADRNRVRVAAALEDPGRVVVEFEDSGCGIAPEIQERIFDPFFTTKSVGEGTGLGLAICHRIVSDLGGDIRVKSAVGVGTTFTLHLPAFQAPVVDKCPSSRSGSGPRSSTPSPNQKLLVIDDQPSVTQVVRRILGGRYDVALAHSAKEALSLIEAQEFDGVLCDLMMPQMTGMDFYEELSKVAPALRQRIIFLTGGAFTLRAQEFLGSVDSPHLEKPFDAHELRALVARMLAQ